MFLNVPLTSTAYGQVIDVFADLEANCSKAGAEAPFKWLLERVGGKPSILKLESFWIRNKYSSSFSQGLRLSTVIRRVAGRIDPPSVLDWSASR